MPGLVAVKKPVEFIVPWPPGDAAFDTLACNIPAAGDLDMMHTARQFVLPYCDTIKVLAPIGGEQGFFDAGHGRPDRCRLKPFRPQPSVLAADRKKSTPDAQPVRGSLFQGVKELWLYKIAAAVAGVYGVMMGMSANLGALRHNRDHSGRRR